MGQNTGTHGTGTRTHTRDPGAFAPNSAGFLAVSVMSFGARADGTTDDTAAVNRAIAAVMNNGGGTVFFPAGTYRIEGCIQPPYEHSNTPIQKPLRLIGAGAAPDSYLGNSISAAGNREPSGGTVLDLRYAGGVAKQLAKIDTRGGGLLEIAHMTLADRGASNYRMLRTTNTTLRIHHVVFCGNPANSGTACVQDGIQLGGDLTTNAKVLDTDADNSGFQGYGTQIGPMVFFRHLRRCIEIGSAGNSITVEGCVVDFTCGSAAAIDAPFILYGNGYQTWGNVFRNCTVEVHHYEYGYVLKTLAGGGGSNYNFIETGTWDETVGFTQGVVYFEAGSIYNIVQMLATNTSMEATLAAGPGAGSNTVIGMSRRSSFPSLRTHQVGQANQFAGSLGVRTGGVDPRSHVDVGPGTGSSLVRVNGGNTNAADGSAVFFDAAGTARGSVGHYSAYFGGAYSTDMILVGTGKVGLGTLSGQYLLSGTGTALTVGKSGGTLGFYEATPAAKPTVTGSRGGNAALASLLTQLATLGLLTDTTSA